MTDLDIFRENVLAVMKAKGLKTKTLASAARFSNARIYDLINGTTEHGRTGITIKKMSAIADALGLSLSFLLEPSDGTAWKNARDYHATLTEPHCESSTLPSGYEKITAVVSPVRAEQIRQWASEVSHKKS